MYLIEKEEKWELAIQKTKQVIKLINLNKISIYKIMKDTHLERISRKLRRKRRIRIMVEAKVSIIGIRSNLKKLMLKS